MAYALGPFDKRRLRTRCAACRTLHLKCEGGDPCRSCISSGRPCNFEAAIRQAICFRNPTYDNSKCTLYPSQIGTSRHETCIWHFFSSFLPRNNFTARSSDEQQILKSFIHESASLRNAVVAVGDLDLSRQAKMYYSLTAATYHKQAVSSLRVRLIRDTDVDDATLWTLLLLAIFELMFDTTGRGFMIHFTKGLPALVRQRTFNSGETDFCQTFLHTIQMLEVMRSAPFWTKEESTLAEDPRWQQMTQRTADESSDTRSFTALYSLMGRYLPLNNMVFDIVLPTLPENMTPEDRQQLGSIAQDGWNLYYQLEMWYAEHTNCTEAHTPLSLLSKIYHCALAISITAIFNFPHFAHCKPSVPSSSAAILNTQVDELCMLLRSALRDTNLAGILMLWPLRVAGSKSISKDQANQVLEMLREIRHRGFAVAQSFEDVLLEQWKQGLLL